MRIGELSKRAGVSRDTIRLYERQGLIASRQGESPSNRYRDYPETALVTLELIADAQAAGMTLAEVTIFQAELESAPQEGFDGITFLDAKIAEVAARMDRAGRFLATLRATRDALARAPEG